MDEDNLSRALMIAVSIFIGIITISAIIIYFNTAIGTVRNIGSGMDYDQVYRDDIESSLLMNGTNNYIKGTNVINIINYYETNQNITIYIQNIKYVDQVGAIQLYNEVIISSSDMEARKYNCKIASKIIMNNQDFTINVQTEDEVLNSKLIIIKGV